jgi:hypothetical protein
MLMDIKVEIEDWGQEKSRNDQWQHKKCQLAGRGIRSSQKNLT